MTAPLATSEMREEAPYAGGVPQYLQGGGTDGHDVQRLHVRNTHMHGGKRVFPAQEIGEEHRETDPRCNAGGKDGTEHAHPEHIQKEQVKHDVREAPRDHRAHGKLGRSVIAHKALQHRIVQKERRTQQKRAQVGVRHGVGVRIGTEQPGERCGQEGTGQHEQSRKEGRKQDRMCKDRIPLLCVAGALS